MPPMYPPEMVKPMREELTSVGFKELLTPEDVDRAVQAKGTTLCVVNSICGCAAGAARPGIAAALQHKVIPDHLVSVFAGMEGEATARVREFHRDAAPPSSPSMVLFKDGQVLGVVPRGQIEGRGPDEIAEGLRGVFDQHCSRPGPSIPPEAFAKLGFAKSCGSNIPRMG